MEPLPGVSNEELVPDDVIPHQHLPPLRYRDMPEAVSWKRMVGPGLMLAGLALGSGEFILWPHITYKSGFVFFWAAVLGVVTQFFLNMEIERWTLATGESAITGFCRLSRWWAPIFLVLNIVPWAWPGWATAAGELLGWLMFGPPQGTEAAAAAVHYGIWFGIAGLWLVGIVLTAGPVVYNTVERLQTILVSAVMVLVVVLAAIVVRGDAVVAMLHGLANIGGMPPESAGLSMMALLGALAFAGAGGTTNLGQSNYIKDKGYGMGRYIGRITSPITGNEEAISEVGYHFRHTRENLRRWDAWWRAANVEHACSFLVTCVVCLALMTLIAYSLLYRPDGTPAPGTENYAGNLVFIQAQADILSQRPLGTLLRWGFLAMGTIILLTTELGVLDAVSRISADIVKTNWLRGRDRYSVSRLYYAFLWSEILLGTGILLYGSIDPQFAQPQFLIQLAAAMNGGVMFLYSLLLLYMNNKVLARRLSMGPVRFVACVWSCAFFGYFTIQTLQHQLWPAIRSWFT